MVNLCICIVMEHERQVEMRDKRYMKLQDWDRNWVCMGICVFVREKEYGAMIQERGL